MALARQWLSKAYDPGLKYHPETVKADPRQPHRGNDPETEREIVEDDPYSYDEAAAERLEERRHHIALNEEGHDKSNLFAQRGTDTRGLMQGGSQRQTAMMMADMVASQAYQQAYDNTVSFNIGGQERDFKQGDMHDYANNLAEQEQERLEKLRKEGASAEEIRRAERNLKDLQRISELTDPEHGELTDEEQQEIQRIFETNGDVAQEFASLDDINKQAEQTLNTVDEINADTTLSSEERSMQINQILGSESPEVVARYNVLKARAEEAENLRSGSEIEIGEMRLSEVVPVAPSVQVVLDLNSFLGSAPPSNASYSSGLDGGIASEISLNQAFNNAMMGGVPDRTEVVGPVIQQDISAPKL